VREGCDMCTKNMGNPLNYSINPIGLGTYIGRRYTDIGVRYQLEVYTNLGFSIHISQLGRVKIRMTNKMRCS
jgi:hypothetical protein